MAPDPYSDIRGRPLDLKFKLPFCLAARHYCECLARHDLDGMPPRFDDDRHRMWFAVRDFGLGFVDRIPLA